MPGRWNHLFFGLTPTPPSYLGTALARVVLPLLFAFIYYIPGHGFDMNLKNRPKRGSFSVGQTVRARIAKGKSLARLFGGLAQEVPSRHQMVCINASNVWD